MNIAENIVAILFALSLISCGTTTAPTHPPRDVRAASSPPVNRVDTSSYSAELAEATRGIFSWSRIRDRNIIVDLHITGWKRPGQTRAEPITVTEEWKPQSKYCYIAPLLTHESRERVGGLSFDPCYSSLHTGDGALTLERTESDDEIKYRGMNNRQEHVELTIDKSPTDTFQNCQGGGLHCARISRAASVSPGAPSIPRSKPRRLRPEVEQSADME